MTGDDLGQRVQEVMTKAEATVERPVSPSGAGAKGLNRRGFMVALVGASGTMLACWSVASISAILASGSSWRRWRSTKIIQHDP
jgi:hypothetical protein